jgi:DNA (cytosine-5)-methyltransferase 1
MTFAGRRADMQLNLDIHGELIIDNFAGGGGASTGIELALGRRVDVAINHDPEAVAMHTANHPETRHYCESVWNIDPREVTQGRPVGLVWLSPDCKHFSKAKGGKPVEKKIRGLAWVALRWADVARPRVIMLENVEEFRTWGPLVIDGDGKARPCPKNKGREFNAFCNALRRHGYHVEHRELRACDYGTPTIRKRLFLIARRDGQPIVWPEATHGGPRNIATRAKKLKPWRTAAECIDFSLPCPSIFERTRPLADATLSRIAKGVMRYVVEAAEPFIVGLAHGEHKERAGSRSHSISEPVRTVHAGGGNYALVAPALTEHANASSPRSMPADEPLRTICAQTKGGHHALVSAFLAKHYGGVVGTGLDTPISTVTSIDHHSLVTVSTDGPHAEDVRAFLIKYYGNEQDGVEVSEPMHTVTARERFGLVTVAGTEYQIADIGMRMLAPRELYKAQGFPDDYIIEHGIDATGKRIPLTKTAQVRMCGNSVCPPLAAALVAANLPEMTINRRAA